MIPEFTLALIRKLATNDVSPYSEMCVCVCMYVCTDKDIDRYR